MPSNTSAKKKKVYKIAKKKSPEPKKEKLFKVILTLTFRQHVHDIDELEKDSWENNEKFCERLTDWKESDKEFSKAGAIEARVKRHSAMDMVEFIPDGDVLAARWVDGPGMKLEFIFKPLHEEDTVEKVEKWLKYHSLEDGEYEGSGDSGWLVSTLKDTMHYGETDYRRNPIVVEETTNKTFSGGARRKTRRNRKH